MKNFRAADKTHAGGARNMISIFIGLSYAMLMSPNRAKQLSTAANVSRTHESHSPFMALYAASKLRHVVRMRIRDMTYLSLIYIYI
jgi:hypothetical protein